MKNNNHEVEVINFNKSSLSLSLSQKPSIFIKKKLRCKGLFGYGDEKVGGYNKFNFFFIVFGWGEW